MEEKKEEAARYMGVKIPQNSVNKGRASIPLRQ